MPEHEGYRLNDRLQGKKDTRSRLRTFSERAYKICIRHIVYIRDQHRDGGRYAEREDQL